MPTCHALQCYYGSLLLATRCHSEEAEGRPRIARDRDVFLRRSIHSVRSVGMTEGLSDSAGAQSQALALVLIFV
jgi:hypothetical protein